ncbi:MAG: hypothetical protein HY703_00580 [Gemmatimonadetes bacterium]|nr:hypothetical protein [Gemmatimonadota bacterium]
MPKARATGHPILTAALISLAVGVQGVAFPDDRQRAALAVAEAAEAHRQQLYRADHLDFPLALGSTGGAVKLPETGQWLLNRLPSRSARPAVTPGVFLDSSCAAASRARAVTQSELDFGATLAAARAGIITAPSTAPPRLPLA